MSATVAAAVAAAHDEDHHKGNEADATYNATNDDGACLVAATGTRGGICIRKRNGDVSEAYSLSRRGAESGGVHVLGSLCFCLLQLFSFVFACVTV